MHCSSYCGGRADYRDAELEGSGDGDGGAGDHHRNRRGGGSSPAAITAAPGGRGQERLLRFLILMLHLGSGRPGFSLSVGRASLVFGAELTRTAGVLAVDRSSNPAVTDMTDACLLPSPLSFLCHLLHFVFLMLVAAFLMLMGTAMI